MRNGNSEQTRTACNAFQGRRDSIPCINDRLSASRTFGLYKADQTPPSALPSTPTTSESLVLFHLSIMNGPSCGGYWLLCSEQMIYYFMSRVAPCCSLNRLSRAWPLSKTPALTPLGAWMTSPAERTHCPSTNGKNSGDDRQALPSRQGCMGSSRDLDLRFSGMRRGMRVPLTT